MAPFALVIDVGNTRLKVGRLDDSGLLVETFAAAIDDREGWPTLFDRLATRGTARLAIASVNPEAADALAAMLAGRGGGAIRWFRSADDVPIRHALSAPGRTGADRALAVLAAVERAHRPGPGIVVQCGTAITVERIDAGGTWQGGAIAIGPGLAARALHSGTAQLPEIDSLFAEDPPPAWGPSTRPAMTAGLVWGAAGTIRELIARQAEGLDPAPWVVWTGGDAPGLARLVSGADARIEPDLVLLGLAAVVARDRDATP